MSDNKERFNINLNSNINSKSGPGTAKRASVSVQSYISGIEKATTPGMPHEARLHHSKLVEARDRQKSTKPGKQRGLRKDAKFVKGKSKKSGLGSANPADKKSSSYQRAVKGKGDL